MDSSPDNDGTDQHCQMVRVRQARRKGVREAPAAERPSRESRQLETWRIRALVVPSGSCQRAHSLCEPRQRQRASETKHFVREARRTQTGSPNQKRRNCHGKLRKRFLAIGAFMVAALMFSAGPATADLAGECAEWALGPGTCVQY